MFYAALHLLDAYLARKGVHPRNHAARNRHLSQEPQLNVIWNFYRDLYDRSIDARYDCVPFSQAIVGTLRQVSYGPLEQHLRAVLGI